MGVEIEKKFLVKELPEGLDGYPFHVIEQGYLNVYPAIRVRREDDIYYMTYKGDIGAGSVRDSDASEDGSDADEKDVIRDLGNTQRGRIGKTEYNLPLDRDSYDHLVKKADGNMIRKKRYLIPLNMDAFSEEYLDKRPELAGMAEDGDIKIELDVFYEPFKGSVLAEIEFPDEEAAANYVPADWFGKEVTGDRRYSNAFMSSMKL